MFALILSDGDLNLPQHLLIDGADRRSQLRHRRRGVPVEYAEKILMLKGVLRLQSAAGQQGIGDADGGDVPKRHAYIEIIIALQKGIVNDAENVTLVVVPVFIV